MPDPKKFKKENDFMHECVPTLLKEGKKQDQAVAICLSMWRNRNKKKSAAEEIVNDRGFIDVTI